MKTMILIFSIIISSVSMAGFTTQNEQKIASSAMNKLNQEQASLKYLGDVRANEKMDIIFADISAYTSLLLDKLMNGESTENIDGPLESVTHECHLLSVGSSQAHCQLSVTYKALGEVSFDYDVKITPDYDVIEILNNSVYVTRGD